MTHDLITKLAPILRVANLEAERSFYELFGLRTTYEGPEYPGFIGLGNGAVEFGLSDDSDADPRAVPTLVHWQLVVSDVDVVIEICKRARLDFEVIVDQPSEELRYRVVKVRSPNGFDVSLEGSNEALPAE